MIFSEYNISNNIDAIKNAITTGEVAVIPTDTVFGLACDYDNSEAIEKLYSIKHRAKDKPIPLLGDSVEAFEKIGVVFDSSAKRLAKAFWPGQMTLVLPLKNSIKQGERVLNTLAVRIPDSKIALYILKHAGPLAVTSANISGENEISDIEEIREVFADKVSVYVDDKSEKSNTASTIVKTGEGANDTADETPENTYEILREGKISRKEIEQALKS